LQELPPRYSLGVDLDKMEMRNNPLDRIRSNSC
jgi:hypothetical protein